MSLLPLISSATLPPLLSYVLLLPIFSAPLTLPLFGLNAQDILFLPAVKAGFLPQHVFWLTQPHIAHRQSWKS